MRVRPTVMADSNTAKLLLLSYNCQKEDFNCTALKSGGDTELALHCTGTVVGSKVSRLHVIPVACLREYVLAPWDSRNAACAKVN